MNRGHLWQQQLNKALHSQYPHHDLQLQPANRLLSSRRTHRSWKRKQSWCSTIGIQFIGINIQGIAYASQYIILLFYIHRKRYAIKRLTRIHDKNISRYVSFVNHIEHHHIHHYPKHQSGCWKDFMDVHCKEKLAILITN